MRVCVYVGDGECVDGSWREKKATWQGFRLTVLGKPRMKRKKNCESLHYLFRHFYSSYSSHSCWIPCSIFMSPFSYWGRPCESSSKAENQVKLSKAAGVSKMRNSKKPIPPQLLLVQVLQTCFWLGLMAPVLICEICRSLRWYYTHIRTDNLNTTRVHNKSPKLCLTGLIAAS